MRLKTSRLTFTVTSHYDFKMGRDPRPRPKERGRVPVHYESVVQKETVSLHYDFKTGCDPHSPFKRMSISYYDFSIKRDPLFSFCSTTTTTGITPRPVGLRPQVKRERSYDRENEGKKKWGRGEKNNRFPLFFVLSKGPVCQQRSLPFSSSVWAFEGFPPHFL